CVEFRRRVPAGEHVVVISRDGHHREDLAVLRIHRNADGLRELVFLNALAQFGIEELLETVVDRERDRVPDRWSLQRERLDLALRGIALDLAPAIRPAEISLVDVFDAGPSEIVVGEITAFLERRELLLCDRPRVSD